MSRTTASSSSDGLVIVAMPKKYEWKAPGTAYAAVPMALGVRATRKLDRWLVGECAGRLRPHTATYLANGAAELLGIATPPLDYEVLHPLAATVRERCAALGIPVRSLMRDDEGSQPKSTGVNLPKAGEKVCTACGRAFVAVNGRRTRCDSCRDHHRRRMLPMRTCCFCGGEYRPRVPNARYCSTSCASRARAERERARKAAMGHMENGGS